MNSKQLFYVQGESEKPEALNIFQCTECGKLYNQKDIADHCCTPKICPDCGNIISESSYYTKCGMCATNDKIEKFKSKVKFIDDQYDDEIWVEEEWYDSISDYVAQTFSKIEDIQEVHAYTSENYKIQFSHNVLMEDLESLCIDDLPEDWSLKDSVINYDVLSDKIKEAVEEFNLVQKELFFRPNYNEGILYTEEYLKKLFEDNE